MLKQSQVQKQTARLSMKLWLPILESSLEKLSKSVEDMAQTNLYMQVKKGSSLEPRAKREIKGKTQKSSSLDEIAGSAVSKEESLFDKLLGQIEPPLFPTEPSQKVARAIIENLDEDGFFDGDIALVAKECGCEESYAERIRERFISLEPCGVGARDVKEALFFQLMQQDIREELYEAVRLLIFDRDAALKTLSSGLLKEAKKLLSRFRTAPAIEYKESSAPITPDVSIIFENDRFEVRLNSLYYPDIIIDKELASEGGEFAKEKVKEAMMVSNLINLRKTTLQNIVNIIIQKQFKFFLGGELVPLKIQDVADILGYNQSTISRAVANKYLSCERGLFAFRYFFSFAVSESVSTNELKSFVKNLVENEDKRKPLNDEEMLVIVQKRFGIKLVRRSITKYRLELGIPSSKERKKEYLFGA